MHAQSAPEFGVSASLMWMTVGMMKGREWRSVHKHWPTSTSLSDCCICVRGEGVQGVLTLFCGGVAQTCHDDQVFELKEQLGIEEEDGEGQERPVKEEGRDRAKENAPWV